MKNSRQIAIVGSGMGGITSARLWDEERYQAALCCYQSMRRIDDMVDNLKSHRKQLGQAEKNRLEKSISSWTGDLLQPHTSCTGYPEKELPSALR